MGIGPALEQRSLSGINLYMPAYIAPACSQHMLQTACVWQPLIKK